MMAGLVSSVLLYISMNVQARSYKRRYEQKEENHFHWCIHIFIEKKIIIIIKRKEMKKRNKDFNKTISFIQFNSILSQFSFFFVS